jgi:hypothetical protein
LPDRVHRSERAAPADRRAHRLAGEVLSLPMHPYRDDTVQDGIVSALKSALQ